MAIVAITAAEVAIGGLDASGALNKIDIPATVDVHDATTFVSGGWRQMVMSLRDGQMNLSGFDDYAVGAIDDVLRQAIGVNYPVSVVALGDANGNVAWFANCAWKGSHQTVKVGEPPARALMFETDSPLIRGQEAHPAATLETAAVTGATITLGALTSTQTLYCAVHLLALTGGSAPTVTPIVKSNTSGTWNTRLTGSSMNAVGYQFISLANTSVVDTQWRIDTTVTGSPTSYRYLACLGIL